MIIEAIKHYYGDAVSNITCSGSHIVHWESALPIPDKDKIEELLSIYTNEVYIPSEIDKIAYVKIVKIAPEHQQRNMLARSSEILEKQLKGEELTAEDISDRSYIQSVWNRVKDIRSHAKYLKEQSIAGNNPDINAGWSE